MNTPDDKLRSLKRKWIQVSPQLSNQRKISSRKSTKAFVLKIFPPVGENRPSSLLVVLVDGPVKVPEKEGKKVVGETTLHKGSICQVSVFKLNENVSEHSKVCEGSEVSLSSLRSRKYQGKYYYTGNAGQLKSPCYEVATRLPASSYKLPAYLDGDNIQNFILPIGTTIGSTTAITWGIHDGGESVYTIRKENGETMLGASLETAGGYPLFVEDKPCSLKFYSDQLKGFGIMDVLQFCKLAPNLFDHLVAVVVGHTKCDGVLTASALYIDLASTIKSAAFPVKSAFVKAHFKNKPFVQSRLADENPLFKGRFAERSTVICLDEYNGTLEEYFEEEKWELYALVDADQETMRIKPKLSLDNVTYTTSYIFALKVTEDLTLD